MKPNWFFLSFETRLIFTVFPASPLKAAALFMNATNPFVLLAKHRMEEALDTFYGFQNMTPSQKEALQRALRAKTPAQMAVRDEESRSRFGNSARQTGQPSSRRPHCLPVEGRDDGLASRQSERGNGGAQVQLSSFGEVFH